jgi:hypothetical protein
VLPEYLELYYATKIPRSIIENKAKSSAGQQGILGKDLKHVPVALAPLVEQRCIVVKIEALVAQDDAIEAAVNSGCGQLARSACCRCSPSRLVQVLLRLSRYTVSFQKCIQ